MKSGEKKFHRLELLAKVWLRTDKSESAVVQRAMKMGVTITTANNYLKTIKGRYPK